MRVLLIGLLVVNAAQVLPIRNPSGLAFVCPDHATDTAHEIAAVRESDGAIVQTYSVGDPAIVGAEVIATFNVQPLPHGRYRFKARAGVTTPEGIIWSDWSDLTDVWERAPGKLTDLRIIAK